MVMMILRKITRQSFQEDQHIVCRIMRSISHYQLEGPHSNNMMTLNHLKIEDPNLESSMK
jgi:hypothetical protein